MSAYNDLLIIVRCPACGQQATVRCQVRIASAYEGGRPERPGVGEYRLGQRLPWWPPGDPRFESWRQQADRANPDGTVDECTFAACQSCGANLQAGVRFRDVTPVEILGVSVTPPDLLAD